MALEDKVIQMLGKLLLDNLNLQTQLEEMQGKVNAANRGEGNGSGDPKAADGQSVIGRIPAS
jgi:hypothetical protein